MKVFPMTKVLFPIFGALVLLGVATRLAAEPTAAAKEHRVVFQVNVGGDNQWDAVIGNIEHVREAFGPQHVQVALVAHGKGLGLLIAAENKHADRIKNLADGGVKFIACENTMKKQGVQKSQLLPFVTTVDSGVAEIIRRQEQGWSYIKAGT
jgi:intracellular sulfur oxidation DsrE/DsrF family protein